MLRVLCVDDDRLSSLLFAETCRAAGGVEVEVEVADSGAEALSLVQAWTPDLLVIDLHLPDVSGYALLPALRSRMATPATAFLCTADEATLVEQPAREAGFDGCWTKPVHLAAVQAAVACCRQTPA